MLNHVRSRFLRRRDQRGASAVEYGLLITGIAAVIAVTVFAFGSGVTDLFNDTCETITAETSTTADCPTE